MSACVHHNRVKVTLQAKGHDLFACIGDVHTNAASPLRNLRHVRQNPDLGRAQLASLLRASRRVSEQEPIATAKGWSSLVANMAHNSANDTL